MKGSCLGLANVFVWIRAESWGRGLSKSISESATASNFFVQASSLPVFRYDRQERLNSALVRAKDRQAVSGQFKRQIVPVLPRIHNHECGLSAAIQTEFERAIAFMTWTDHHDLHRATVFNSPPPSAIILTGRCLIPLESQIHVDF
jgi:hypothetical protein